METAARAIVTRAIAVEEFSSLICYRTACLSTCLNQFLLFLAFQLLFFPCMDHIFLHGLIIVASNILVVIVDPYSWFPPCSC